MSEQAQHNYARQKFHIGPYRFARHHGGPQNGKWEAEAHGRGVGGSRTPVHAFIALRRWMKEPARPQ